MVTCPSQSLLVSKLNSPLPRKLVMGGGDQGVDIFGGPILPPQMAGVTPPGPRPEACIRGEGEGGVWALPETTVLSWHSQLEIAGPGTQTWGLWGRTTG